MDKAEKKLREGVVENCRRMNACGLNQGTSGNISVRHNDRMLISPSAVPYDDMTPDMVAAMPLDGNGEWDGPAEPSTEWRFHLDILRTRPDAHAVVHTHAAYATALSVTGRGIPPCHYMIARFGGHDVRCAPYARFGTEDLSKNALAALEGRTACLLANHGMIALGAGLDGAMRRAVELEALAKQYHLSLQIGGPVLLNEAQTAEALKAFTSYGAPE